MKHSYFILTTLYLLLHTASPAQQVQWTTTTTNGDTVRPVKATQGLRIPFLKFTDGAIQTTVFDSTNLASLYQLSLKADKSTLLTGGYGMNSIGDLSTNRTISADTVNAKATTSRTGYLSYADWNAFNNKQEPYWVRTGGTLSPTGTSDTVHMNLGTVNSGLWVGEGLRDRLFVVSAASSVAAFDNTNNVAAAQEALSIRHLPSVPAPLHGAALGFRGYDGSGTVRRYARIDVPVTDTTVGSIDGRMDFYTTGNGVETRRLMLDEINGRSRMTLGTGPGVGAGRVYAGDSLYIGSTLLVDAGRNISPAGIHVVGNNPQLRLSDSETDATIKNIGIGGTAYTTANRIATIANLQATSTNNFLTLGGGTSAMNAATVIAFNTAEDNNTATGTERMRITSAGNVGIGRTPSSTTRVEVQASNNQLYLQRWFRSGSGSEVVLIDSNGSTRVSDGTVSAPALSFISQSNTGFYRAGTHDIRFSLNGSDVFGFQPGNVQIRSGTNLTWVTDNIANIGTGNGVRPANGFFRTSLNVQNSNNAYRFSADTSFTYVAGLRIGLNNSTVFAKIDSVKVESDTLKFFVNGIGYKAIRESAFGWIEITMILGFLGVFSHNRTVA